MLNYKKLYDEFNDKYADAQVKDLNSLVAAVKANKAVESKYKNMVRGGEFFQIDLETRAITVPASYRKNGLGVVGDDAADIAWFKLDRYYGQTDLENCEIVIIWQAGKNSAMFSAAYNKEVGEDYITFGWVIDKRIVAAAGNVKFSVRIFQLHEEANTTDLLYSLNTVEATCAVKDSAKFDVAVMAGLDMEALKRANEEALGAGHVHSTDGEQEPRQEDKPQVGEDDHSGEVHPPVSEDSHIEDEQPSDNGESHEDEGKPET